MNEAPSRFEDEHPESAEILMRLARWKQRVPWWHFTVDGQIRIRQRERALFPLREPGRNQPCGCGSSEKFKVCCQPLLRFFTPE